MKYLLLSNIRKDKQYFYVQSLIELKGNNQARKLLKEMNISLAKSATVTLRLVRVVLDDTWLVKQQQCIENL